MSGSIEAVLKDRRNVLKSILRHSVGIRRNTITRDTHARNSIGRILFFEQNCHHVLWDTSANRFRKMGKNFHTPLPHWVKNYAVVNSVAQWKICQFLG